jgi:hypothetical protein
LEPKAGNSNPSSRYSAGRLVQLEWVSQSLVAGVAGPQHPT